MEDSDSFDDELARARELERVEEELRNRIVKEALGKFNFFLHLTAFFAGSAYLVLLGVFIPETLPYIFIPIGLWAIGIAYHAWRAWHPKSTGDEVIENLDKSEKKGRRKPRLRKK